MGVIIKLNEELREVLIKQKAEIIEKINSFSEMTVCQTEEGRAYMYRLLDINSRISLEIDLIYIDIDQLKNGNDKEA